MLVQLKFASLRGPLRLVAVHFWFTAGGERWEVWQRRDAGGTALRLKETLEDSARSYPYLQRYRPWPGPNSSTFAAWVLRRCGIDDRLPWKAIGRSFTCPAA